MPAFFIPKRVPKHIVDRLAAGQQAGDGTDGDPDAADAGFAAHHAGIDGDSVKVWEAHARVAFALQRRAGCVRIGAAAGDLSAKRRRRRRGHSRCFRLPRALPAMQVRLTRVDVA
jgi:hypothetical protein